MKPVFFPLVLSIFLVGCVSKNPATGQYNLVTMTEQQEFSLGHEVAVEGIKQGGGLYNEMPELTAYLRQLGKDVVNVSERADQPFRFKLLDSPVINAWAIPGYIAFHRGILPLFNNEAELITVLGHEVGHVTARHTVRSQAGAVIANIGIVAVQAVVGARTGSQQAVDAAGQLGVGVAHVGMAGYSRRHELEADQLGLRYMSRLGYDPAAASGTFKALKAYGELAQKIAKAAGNEQQQSLYHKLLASHPDEVKRVGELDQAAEEELSGGTKLNTKQYLEKIDGLAWGPKIKDDGVYGFRRHYDAERRLMFDIPEKWFFPRMGGLPMAANPEEKIYMEAVADKIEKDTSAEEALFYEFPKARHLQPVAVSRADGYTGLIEEKGNKIRVVAIKLDAPALPNNKRTLLLFKFTAPEDGFEKADPQFKSIINSIRRLSLKQAKELEPLRVRIHEVQHGETVEKIAKRLPFEVFHEEYFRMLNGLEPNEKLKAGEWVKVIRDPNRDKIK